jgi:hypothetical protein
MRRINRAGQIPPEKIQDVAHELEGNPRKNDGQIAFELGLARATVNSIRHVSVDHPLLFKQVLAGDISLAEALRLAKGSKIELERDHALAETERLGAEVERLRKLIAKIIDDIENGIDVNRVIIEQSLGDEEL